MSSTHVELWDAALPSYDDAVAAKGRPVPVAVVPQPAATPAPPAMPPAAEPPVVRRRGSVAMEAGGHNVVRLQPAGNRAEWTCPAMRVNGLVVFFVAIVALHLIVYSACLASSHASHNPNVGLIVGLVVTIAGVPVVLLTLLIVSAVCTRRFGDVMAISGMSVAVISTTLGVATIVGCIYLAVVAEIDSSDSYYTGPVPSQSSVQLEALRGKTFADFTGGHEFHLDAVGERFSSSKKSKSSKQKAAQIAVPVTAVGSREVSVFACSCRTTAIGCRIFPSVDYARESLWYDPGRSQAAVIHSKLYSKFCRGAVADSITHFADANLQLGVPADSVVIVEWADLPAARQYALNVSIGTLVGLGLPGLIGIVLMYKMLRCMDVF